MAAFAIAYVASSTGVTLKPEPVLAFSEVAWGSVGVGTGFSFTPVPSSPAVGAVFTSALVQSGESSGLDLTPIFNSAIVVQGPNPIAPFPAGEQLSFHWSTG
jgi:hypothetical protein